MFVYMYHKTRVLLDGSTFSVNVPPLPPPHLSLVTGLSMLGTSQLSTVSSELIVTRARAFCSCI
jgi:hypothetical protein